MRSTYWDEYKGIAILAVIAIHACSITGNFPAGSFNWHFGLVFRQFLNFAVPLFLAMAGYFAVAGDMAASKVDWKQYYQKRLLRIVVPYAVWTLVFVAIFNRGHLVAPVELLKDFASGLGIGIGYYVIVLLQFLALVPVLVKIPSREIHLLILFVVTVLGCVYTYIARINLQEYGFAQYPYYCLPFFAWYPFFHLGVYAKKFGLFINTEGTQGWRLVLLALVFASIIEAEVFAYLGFYAIGASQVKLSTFLLTILIFLIIVSRASKYEPLRTKPTLLSVLGRHSYIIYLSHLLFLAVVKSLLHKIPFIYHNQIISVTLSSLLTIGLVTGLVFTVKRYVPARMQNWLGM